MSCKQGDSVRAGEIPSYHALIGRENLQEHESYELSYQDALSAYQEVIDNLKSKHYQGIIKPFNSVMPSAQDKHQVTLLIQRNPNFDYVHPDTQVARIISMIQNLLIVNTGNLSYINSFIKRIRSNLSRITQAYLKPYYSGYCLQSLQAYLSQSDIDLITPHIPFINSNLESCSLKSINIDQEEIRPSDINVLVGTLDRNQFKDLISRYHEWQESDTLTIKEQEIRASIHLMLKDRQYPKSDINIKIAQKNHSWIIGMAIPLSVSPYLVIKTLYPKIKLNEIYHKSSFILIDTFKPLKHVSKQLQMTSDKCSCGNSLVYSHIHQQVSSVCLDCYIRSLLAKFANL
jgi:hypothetical protein